MFLSIHITLGQKNEGKMFVQFIALIYLSYIKKQMHVKGLLKNYAFPDLLDKLDVIECFDQPGKSFRVGKMLEKQKHLYHDLGVNPPTSLWIGGNPGFIERYLRNELLNIVNVNYCLEARL